MSSAARRTRADSSATTATRPALPSDSPQPTVILYNVSRESELALRRAIILLNNTFPERAREIGKQIQRIEVMQHGGRIYIDGENAGVLEIAHSLRERSLAYIAASLTFAAARIHTARRGMVSSPLSARANDLAASIDIMEKLGATELEISEQRALLSELEGR